MTLLRPTERLILMHLRSNPTPQGIAEITAAIESTPATVLKRVHGLCKAGLLTRVAIGKYTHYTLASTSATPQQ